MGLSEFQFNKKIQTPFSVWAQARANPNHMTPPPKKKTTITSILMLKSSSTSLCRLTLFGSERKAKQAWCFWSWNINCGLSTNKHDNVTKKKTKQDMLLSFSPIKNHTFCLFKTSNAQLQVSKTDSLYHTYKMLFYFYGQHMQEVGSKLRRQLSKWLMPSRRKSVLGNWHFPHTNELTS